MDKRIKDDLIGFSLFGTLAVLLLIVNVLVA